MARGHILGWLGSDDLYCPDAIARVLDYFDHHPDAQVIYGEAEFIDAAGHIVGRFATRDFSVDRAVNEGPCVAFPAVFYRRHVVDDIGGFSIGDSVCDFEWLVRVGKRFRLERVPFTVCQFRLHSGSTSTSIGELIYPRGNYLVNRRHGGRLLAPVCRRYYQSLVFKVPGIRAIWNRAVAFRGFPAAFPPGAGRFAIFGAALTGFRCLEQIQRHAGDVPFFIDNWPPESGRYCDRPVLTPGAFVRQRTREVDAVIIATNAASRSALTMRRQLRSLGFTGPVYCYGFTRHATGSRSATATAPEASRP